MSDVRPATPESPAPLSRGPTRYYCLIREAGRGRVLLVEDGRGRLSLPCVMPFASSREFLPDDVDAIGRAASAWLGTRAVVLRHLLDDGTAQACELEVLDPAALDARLPPGAAWARWSDADELDDLPIDPPPVRQVLHAWWDEARFDEITAARDRAPWERTGWFAGTSARLASELADRGLPPAGDVTQEKAAWPVSCVLRVPTAGGDVYYKESWPRKPAEGDVLALLAERWPRRVPEVISTTPNGHGLLMRDFGSRRLSDAPDEAWPAAVATYARMQRAECEPGRVRRWLSIGCPDMRPARLWEHFRTLAHDDSALVLGQYALNAREAEALRTAALPRVRAMCAQLERSPVPLAGMHHEDFRAGNVALRPGPIFGDDPDERFIIYDWSWTAVSHPFFSLVYFLTRGLTRCGLPAWDWRLAANDRRRRAICESYLGVWSDVAPLPQLWETLALARKLHWVYRAVMIYQEIPLLEPGTPWWQANAPVLPRFCRYILNQTILSERLGDAASGIDADATS